MNMSTEKAYVESFGLTGEVDNRRGWAWQSYHLGNSHMWDVKRGWQVAELVNGRYQNHLINANLYTHEPRVYRTTLNIAVAEMMRRNHRLVSEENVHRILETLFRFRNDNYKKLFAESFFCDKPRESVWRFFPEDGYLWLVSFAIPVAKLLEDGDDLFKYMNTVYFR